MPTKFSDSQQYLIDAASGIVQLNTPVLEQGYFPKDSTGTAIYFKGKTSVVFSFQQQKKLKAVKLWLAPAGDQLSNRYAMAEKYFANNSLGYFAGTTYLKNAISFKNSSHDIAVMDWVGRQNIKEYIIAHLDQKEKINALAEKLLRLHLDLNQAGIAHGHLHAGNIYIDANDELKLIGYDFIFIKGLMEEEISIQRYPDYCHPVYQAQAKSHLQADYFAALILYLGIKAIAHDAVLWGRYKVGFQENFLFTAADFADIRNASIYKYLKKNQTQETGKLLEILVMNCEEPAPNRLKPFYTYLQQDLLQAGKSVDETVENSNPVRKPLIVAIPANKVHQLKPVPKPAPKNYAGSQAEPVAETKSIIAENNAAAFHSELTTDFLYDTGMPVKDHEEQVILQGQRKNTIKKGAYPMAAKKQQKQFLLAGAVICAIIFAASYFLGGLADDINNPYVQNETAAKTKVEEPVKKIVAAPEKVNKPAVDLPVASIPEPAAQPAVKMVVDTVAITMPPHHETAEADAVAKSVAASTENTKASNEQAVHTADLKTSIAKIKKKAVDSVAVIPPAYHPPVVKNNPVTVVEASVVNTKTNSHQANYSNERKSASVKIKRIKKTSDNSFAIGAPPKK